MGKEFEKKYRLGILTLGVVENLSVAMCQSAYSAFKCSISNKFFFFLFLLIACIANGSKGLSKVYLVFTWRAFFVARSGQVWALKHPGADWAPAPHCQHVLCIFCNHSSLFPPKFHLATLSACFESSHNLNCCISAAFSVIHCLSV